MTRHAIARLDDLAVGVARRARPGARRVRPARGADPAREPVHRDRLRAARAARSRGRVRARARRPHHRDSRDGSAPPAPVRTVHYPAVRAAGAHMGMLATGVDFLSVYPWLVATPPRESDAIELTRATAPVDLPAPAGRSTLLLSPVGRQRLHRRRAAVRRDRRPPARPPAGDAASRSTTARTRPTATRWDAEPVDVAGRTWTLLVERPGRRPRARSRSRCSRCCDARRRPRQPARQPARAARRGRPGRGRGALAAARRDVDGHAHRDRRARPHRLPLARLPRAARRRSRRR